MPRVMVVDDDVTVREVVVTYLRAGGYDVGEAADGGVRADRPARRARRSRRARPDAARHRRPRGLSIGSARRATTSR